MKNFRMLIATAVLLATVSICASAQDHSLMTVKIPFGFNAGNTNLPAGVYTVSTLPPFNMLKVQSTDGRKVAMIADIPSLEPRYPVYSEQTKLVFYHLDGEYFLTQVWERMPTPIGSEMWGGKEATLLTKTGIRLQELF